MSIALAIRNRLAECALLLMLAPFGISLPTFVRASRAEESTQVETAGDDGASIRAVRFEGFPPTVGQVSSEPAYGALHHGGTIGFYNALWDLRPSDGRATRPYMKPRPGPTDRPDGR
jgi:hypothetical protein